MKKQSPLLPIFLIVMIDILGFTIILPLLPFYAESFGATPLVVGWLLSAYGLCQLVSGPILGQISDRIGRKPILLVSQMGTLAGFLLLAFSNSLLPVFLSRVIDGATAGNISVAQAYIADVTEPENRAKSFGLIGIAFGFGFLVGPALAGYLVEFGHQAPIIAAAALSATSIVATAVLLPDSRTLIPLSVTDTPREEPEGFGRSLHIRNYAQLFREPGLNLFLFQFFAFVLSFSIFFSGFALFAERRFFHDGSPFGPKEVGYIFAYCGVLGIIIQGGLIGRLVRWAGEEKLVKVGFFCIASGFLMLGFSTGLFLLLVSITIAFTGVSIVRPSLTSLVTRKCGRQRQGVVLGLIQSLMSVSQITMPFVSGFLIQHQFLQGWTWAGALTSGAGFLLVLRVPLRQPDAASA